MSEICLSLWSRPQQSKIKGSCLRNRQKTICAILKQSLPPGSFSRALPALLVGTVVEKQNAFALRCTNPATFLVMLTSGKMLNFLFTTPEGGSALYSYSGGCSNAYLHKASAGALQQQTGQGVAEWPDCRRTSLRPSHEKTWKSPVKCHGKLHHEGLSRGPAGNSAAG